jgi:hypothetical protein
MPASHSILFSCSRAVVRRRRTRLAGLALAAVAMIVLTAVAPQRAAAAALTPADIHAAYALPNTGAAHQTIAVVSAYDDPAAQADLNDYTKRFGIPACTTANRCFRKLNEAGAASPLPGPDPTGGQEVTESSVGIEVARGVCQNCSIMLVEARSFGKLDLSTAVGAAAKAGATVVVTAWQQGQAPDDSQYASDFSNPHTIVVSATGDSGYTGLATFPASLPSVLAVGGTELKLRHGAYGSETAWDSSTSGCALYADAAAWQASLASSAGCGTSRSLADISAVADPGLVVHIGDLGAPCGKSWCEAGGTSVSAPIIGGVIGLAGSVGSAEPQLLYDHAHADPGALHDVKQGSDSRTCMQKPICQARPGYDGPTGLGTPDGLAAFLASGGAVSRQNPGVQLITLHHRLKVGRSWLTFVGLSNGNAFEIHGTIALTARLRTGGQLREVRFASAPFALHPLGSAVRSLRILTPARGLLTRLKHVAVTAELQVNGPAGRSVALRRTNLELSAP